MQHFNDVFTSIYLRELRERKKLEERFLEFLFNRIELKLEHLSEVSVQEEIEAIADDLDTYFRELKQVVFRSDKNPK